MRNALRKILTVAGLALVSFAVQADDCRVEFGIRVCLPERPAQHVQRDGVRVVVRSGPAPSPFVQFAIRDGQGRVDEFRAGVLTSVGGAGPVADALPH